MIKTLNKRIPKKKAVIIIIVSITSYLLGLLSAHVAITQKLVRIGIKIW